ncbi:MAG: hypothetical protein Q7T20_02580 [Saprospiraceae bacterium]|nr:hypothetical protein [Saprospiraceae bacterium]
MVRIFTRILFILASAPIFAQEPLKEDLAPCGTRGVSDWLRGYKARPPVFDRSEDTLWVALQPHLLARDNGSGRIAAEKFINSFCQLNEDFAASNIQFYIKNGWNLLNETDWHVHSTIPEGIEMMLTNNVPDALNAYFVADPAGNCGYNLPYAGVAIGHSCSGTNDHTWSHEAGHALSLPHPFIGWEGKTYNFSVPTPTWLTYDYTHFHDTLETQVPAPLDTALVEFVNGSNCAQAADLICDTKPDYLSYRWECDAQNMSPIKLKDPNGAEFYSDGSLFMSYAMDHCQSRFSPEEIAVMRATLLTEKSNWLTPVRLEQPVEEQAIAIEPVQDQIVPPVGAYFSWKPVPNATHYLVQASRFASFSFKQVDVVTTDTFLTAGLLSPNLQYYWRIRPFNDWHACAPFSFSETFKTSPLSAASEPDADGWRCYPSLLSAGAPLTLEIPDAWHGTDAQCSVFDAGGRLIWQSNLLLNAPRITAEIPSSHWPAGIYHLILVSEKGAKRCAMVVGPRI